VSSDLVPLNAGKGSIGVVQAAHVDPSTMLLNGAGVQRASSSGELLEALMSDVRLLAAPSAEQQVSLDEHRVPVVELALQYYESYHAFAQRLAEHGIPSSTAIGTMITNPDPLVW
jgi:hypothetical protein